MDILSDLIQDENKSVFFSTHITSDLDKVADYVTFIHDGSIILSATKDDILDNYGIVKGGTDLLNDHTQKAFIGIRKNNFGFEGLVDDRVKARNLFKDNIIIDKPNLEDIMQW